MENGGKHCKSARQLTARAAKIARRKKPPVRDRIFDAACDLFYMQGIRSVSVDMITEAAGTNKMSFYRNFSSKDKLVAKYLSSRADDILRWWDETVVAYENDPRRQIELLFDIFVHDIGSASLHGCALANSLVEITQPDHPGRKIVFDSQAEMRRRFRYLAVKAGAAHADELGDALMLLMEGGYRTLMTFRNNRGPARSAGRVARMLVDAYCNIGPVAASAKACLHGTAKC